MDGVATNPNMATDPGKFEVVYAGANKQGFAWIVRLGEIDSQTGKYQWAVISDPIGVNLFILARNVDEFRDRYESQVILEVEMLGFRFPFNRPRKTYQSTADCQYPPLVPPEE